MYGCMRVCVSLSYSPSVCVLVGLHGSFGVKWNVEYLYDCSIDLGNANASMSLCFFVLSFLSQNSEKRDVSFFRLYFLPSFCATEKVIAYVSHGDLILIKTFLCTMITQTTTSIQPGTQKVN